MTPAAEDGVRSRLVVLAWLLQATALGAVVLADGGPRLEIEDDGGRHLVLSGLPSILGDEEVRPHLTTGLTTSLVFRVQLRADDGRKIPGGARVEIRYELWDEIFQTAVLDPRGRLRRRDLGSFEELESWWRELRLIVLTGLASSGTDPPRSLRGDAAPEGAAGIRLGREPCRVLVDVVPFSRAERDDTRRWFSDSIDDVNRSRGEDVARSADERSETLARTFNVLMATSIEQRPIHTYRFAVPAPGGGS